MRFVWLFLALFSLALATPSTPTLAKLEALRAAYLNESNIWLSTYKNIKNYQEIRLEIQGLEERLKQNHLTHQERIDSSLRLDTLHSKLEFYGALERSFTDIMRLPSEKEMSASINLFKYLTKSYEKEIRKYQKLLQSISLDYEKALEYLKDYKSRTLALLSEASDQEEEREVERFLTTLRDDLAYFQSSQDILQGLSDRLKLYENRLYKNVEEYRHNELPKIIGTILTILLLLLSLYTIRRLITRHIHDDERRFKILKIINLLSLSTIFLVVVFSFADNILYGFTLLGFIGAGLIVSLKEVVQNFIAWLHLSFSGLIKVGDRILLYHETRPVIGDIIAITTSKIVLYESINHTTTQELKRAGRIAFIPNHFVFNHYIFNYTHESMKTLYDLIEIDLEPTSDLIKAETIALQVITERTSRYIELGKKQYSALRAKYDLRHSDFKPQIHFTIENDSKAIRMQIWFISPYRDIMQVRSEITQEFLSAIAPLESIKLKA